MLNVTITSESEMIGSGLKLGKFVKYSQEIDATIKGIIPLLTACRPFPFAVVLPAEAFLDDEGTIQDFESGRIIDQEEKKNYMVVVEGLERYKAHLFQKTKTPEKQFGFLFIEELAVPQDIASHSESRAEADVTD